MRTITNIKTRRDLVNVIDMYHGCKDARDFALKFPGSTPAKVIWNACDDSDWLFHLGIRWNPQVGLKYVENVLKRMKKEHAISATPHQRDCLSQAVKEYDRAREFLRRDQIDGFRGSITWAFHDAWCASRSSHEEAELRLKELHGMW